MTRSATEPSPQLRARGRQGVQAVGQRAVAALDETVGVEHEQVLRGQDGDGLGPADADARAVSTCPPTGTRARRPP